LRIMKSREQMGEKPEQPEEKPLENKEETFEKPASPEYDKDEWGKLKEGNAVVAIDKGRKMGVPQEELDQLAQDYIARETESRNYGIIYRFRKNMGIGTEDEVRAAGEQAYKFFIESGDSGSAMGIAEDVYGKDSNEWRRANEVNEAKWKKTIESEEGEEQELNVTISRDATFADLFKAVDAIEEEKGFDKLHFEEDLAENFGPKILKEILDFQNAQADKVATTKVLDFFKKRGYSQSYISAFLPIKFKRERKKK
jgi:hypothetical protein